MKLTRTAALAIALTFAAGSVVAQTTRTVTLGGYGHISPPGTVTLGGYVVGPYWGSSPGMGDFNLYCVDFLHSARVGQTWTAYFTQISNGAAISTGNYTRLTDQLKYQRAAWLASNFLTHPTASAWQGIHGTIWNEMSGQSFATGDWLAQLDNADLTAMNYDYWQVVTDVNFKTGGTQEFLVHVTPEPGTILLMASGLVALVGAAVVTKRAV